MRKKFQFKSIRARLTFWFFIMAMIPLIMVNIVIYIHIVHSMKVSIFNNIEAIRDLKANEVNHWLNERITDVRIIASSDVIRRLEELNIDKEERRHTDFAIASKARILLDRYLKNNDDFHEFLVVSPTTRNIMISTRREIEGELHSKDVQISEVLEFRDLAITDIHYSDRLDKPSMGLSVPVLSSMHSNRIIGILVANINLETSLYEILSSRTGVGRTGETLIVNKKGMALSRLRWHDNTPLMLNIKSQPAVYAATGRTGIMEIADYRAEKTLAAYTYLPLAGWGFIAKQDLKEVYAPIYRLRKWMLAIVFMTLLGVIINTVLVLYKLDMKVTQLVHLVANALIM